MSAPATSAQPWPAGVTVRRRARGIVVTRRWRNMASWALLPLALVTAGMAVPVVRAMSEVPWTDPMQAITVLIGGAALVLGFVTLRRLVNVTRLEVSAHSIGVSHGPLPWRRPTTLDTATICRLDVRRYHWRYDGGRATHHHLWAVHHDGRETPLLDRDETEAEARCVQAELQRVLGLGVAEPPSEGGRPLTAH